MILKIAVDEAWKFIDNIKELYTHKFNDEQYNQQGHSLPTESFLFYHSTAPDAQIKTNDGPAGRVDVVEIYATLKNGETKVYLSDLTVYLLSDEGKTIERIN